MRFALLSFSLVAVFGGCAGFMSPCVAPRRACSSSSSLQASRGIRSASSSYKGQLPATTGARASASRALRMGGEQLAADGGAEDGAALAEARIVVEGQSTGGYFRAHARNEAHFNRKLCGALKELGQGRTEIIVEGKTSAIRSFLRWCKKGPGLSQRIQEVTIDWTEYTGIFDGFEVFPDEAPQSAVAGVP